MNKWWRGFNSTEGGYEKYITDDILTIARGALMFLGFFSIMVWL